MRNHRCLWRSLLCACFLGATVSPAVAYDNSKIIDCPSCTGPYWFKQAAEWDSQSIQTDATYTVVGAEGWGSAYVQISGQWWPDGFGGYIWYPSSNLVDTNGYQLSSDSSTAMAQMSQIDTELFGFQRTAQSGSTKILAIKLPNNHWMQSFYDQPPTDGIESNAINNQIGLRGINPVALPAGRIVTVIYPDGTKAQFVKSSLSTWTWNGVAWDEEGRRIVNRDGDLLIKTFNGTNLGGSGAYVTQAPSPTTGLTADWNLFFWGQLVCQNRQSGVFYDDETWEITISSYVPCR